MHIHVSSCMLENEFNAKLIVKYLIVRKVQVYISLIKSLAILYISLINSVHLMKLNILIQIEIYSSKILLL